MDPGQPAARTSLRSLHFLGDIQPEGFLDGFPNLVHLLPGRSAQVLPHAPLVDGFDLLQQHHAGKLQPTDALCVVVGRLGRLFAGLGRDGRDDQRGAVVVAGVVLQEVRSAHR